MTAAPRSLPASLAVAEAQLALAEANATIARQRLEILDLQRQLRLKVSIGTDPDLAVLRQHVETVARETGVTAQMILSSRRIKQIVAARWRVWALLHSDGMSMSCIGRLFGTDHSTVLYGLRRIGAVQ